jgi:hypothetical protein
MSSYDVAGDICQALSLGGRGGEQAAEEAAEEAGFKDGFRVQEMISTKGHLAMMRSVGRELTPRQGAAG